MKDIKKPCEIERKEVFGRINKFRDILNSEKLDGALIMHKPDLFYFSLTVQRACLFIPAEGKPILFVIKNFIRASYESPLEQIVHIKSFKEIPSVLIGSGMHIPKRLGLELDVLPAKFFVSLKLLFGSAEILDISERIKHIRAVKSKYEINIIKKASEKADLVLSNVVNFIKPGMTEIELSGKIEGFARKLGHQGIFRTRSWGNEIFYCSVLAGPAGAEPTYLESPNGGLGPNGSVANGSGFSVIKRNEPIFIDFAFVYEGYIADVSRTFCIGKPVEVLEQAHQQTLSIQEKILEKLREGNVGGEIYDFAFDLAINSRFSDNFMGYKENSVKFIAHGTGLELDELPVLGMGQKVVLEENMVISMEPKMLFPNHGMVGVENVYRITKTGAEKLTKLENQIILI